MRFLLYIFLFCCQTIAFAQQDPVAIHSRNLANTKAPTWSNREAWRFTFWEEEQRNYYFYSNGLLTKKSMYSNHYLDTAEKTIYTYDSEGYLIKREFFAIYKRQVMALYSYETYERSADKKFLSVKSYTHYDQFDSVILYSIDNYRYDDRNQIIHSHSSNFWISDSSFHISNYHSELRTYLNQKSNKLRERIDSSYNSSTKLVDPTYKYLFVYDPQERVRIILRYAYTQNDWTLINKDSLVYHNQESAPNAYYRINYNSSSNEYFTNMKWYDFKSVNLIERQFNLQYFEYDLYSYIRIANTPNGMDTVLRRDGIKTDQNGSILYYEYRNNMHWELRLSHKFVHYYDDLGKSKMYYYRGFDTLNNTWFGMSGRYQANDYDFQNNITTNYSGNLTGDSFIYYIYKYNYFDYVDVKLGQNELKIGKTNIYPNPFQHYLSIDSDGKKIQSINIYNTLGELVYTNNNVIDNKINLSLLPKGIYLLKLRLNEEERVFRIAKE
jgi:hypothetical protein